MIGSTLHRRLQRGHPAPHPHSVLPLPTAFFHFLVSGPGHPILLCLGHNLVYARLGPQGSHHLVRVIKITVFRKGVPGHHFCHGRTACHRDIQDPSRSGLFARLVWCRIRIACSRVLLRAYRTLQNRIRMVSWMRKVGLCQGPLAMSRNDKG